MVERVNTVRGLRFSSKNDKSFWKSKATIGDVLEFIYRSECDIPNVCSLCTYVFICTRLSSIFIFVFVIWMWNICAIACAHTYTRETKGSPRSPTLPIHWSWNSSGSQPRDLTFAEFLLRRLQIVNVRYNHLFSKVNNPFIGVSKFKFAL